MTTRTLYSMSLLALMLIPLVVLACGSDTTPPEATPELEAPAATPVAEAEGDSRMSLEDYLLAVCGESEVGVWEEGVSLRELSSGLEMITEQMEALDPPAEVSGWHDAQLAFQGTFKQTIDDYLEDPRGRSEDEFLLSTFATLVAHFQPVDQAIAGMDPDVRSQMVTAGCIDEETGAVPMEDAAPAPTGVERQEIPCWSKRGGLAGRAKRERPLPIRCGGWRDVSPGGRLARPTRHKAEYLHAPQLQLDIQLRDLADPWGMGTRSIRHVRYDHLLAGCCRLLYTVRLAVWCP